MVNFEEFCKILINFGKRQIVLSNFNEFWKILESFSQILMNFGKSAIKFDEILIKFWNLCQIMEKFWYILKSFVDFFE